MKKSLLITIAIIIGVIVFAIIMRSAIHNGVPQDVSKCIGQNSELYIQLGCHACETQKQLFGEDINNLNIIDCFYEREKCDDIQYTPTWIIKGEKYIGVQTIEKLKEITGC